MSISRKLTLSYLFIGILTVSSISYIFYSHFRDALIERTLAQLSSINVLKKNQIEDYFSEREDEVEAVLSYFPLNDFLSYYDSLPQGSRYDDAMAQIQDELSYKGLLLVNSEGEIVYEHTTEDEPFTNITHQQDIAVFTSKVFSLNSKRITHLDLSSVSDQDTTFVLTCVPIENVDSSRGLLLLHRNFQTIQHLLHEHTGMGRTGESYIVGDDYLMRSESRFFPNKHPMQISVRTKASKQAFSEEDDKHIIKDYRNINVLSAFRKLDIAGLDWVIISEIDIEEAMIPVYDVRNHILLVASIILSVIGLVTFLIARNISSPIKKIKEIILDLSRGKLHLNKTKVRSNDEIGEISVAINELITSLEETSTFAEEIGAGNFQVQHTPLSTEDTLGHALLNMRDRLQSSHQLQQEQNKQRTAALLEGQEGERARIARELHDGLGPLLTTIKLQLSNMDINEEDKSTLKNRLDETISEVRRISNNLMPSALLDFGFIEGIHTHCSLIEKNSDLSISLNIDCDNSMKLETDTSISLFRIVQEAINNTIKYAQASKITISITQFDDALSLFIRDNGKGFDYEQYETSNTTSKGIKNIRERVNLLNGYFNISSEINQGTTIEVEIPLN